VSDELSEAVLQGERVILPFEDLPSGKQVSTVVAVRHGIYAAYDFFDAPDAYRGPSGIRKSQLESAELEAAIETLPSVSFQVQKLLVTWSSFLLSGKVERVIERLDFFDPVGGVFSLRREGAAYPYCLVLSD
jgi:hypothetical protein